VEVVAAGVVLAGAGVWAVTRPAESTEAKAKIAVIFMECPFVLR